MITQIEWQSDLSKAPKGEMVKRSVAYERNGEKSVREWEEFVPTKILALTRCGKVIQTYWVPEKRSTSGNIMRHGHFSGFAETPEFSTGGPVMWANWPKPPVDQLEAAE